MKAPFTREFLLTYLNYDRENAAFFWKDHWCRAKPRFIGKLAGCRKHTGYWHIKINDKLYLRHKLIWFIEKGTWPDIVDHIQGVEKGDHISNLREATHRSNANNTFRHRKGKLTGASFHKNSGRWTAQIHDKGVKIHLGYFNTELKAHQKSLNEMKLRGLL